MSLRFEMNANIPSTYGNPLAEKPRDMQTKQKATTTSKPILRVKRNG